MDKSFLYFSPKVLPSRMQGYNLVSDNWRKLVVRELGLDQSDFRIGIGNSNNRPKLLEYRNRELFRYQISTRIR